MKKFVMVVNGEFYFKDDGKNVFVSEEDIKKELIKWNDGKDSFSCDDGDVLNGEELVGKLIDLDCVIEVCELSMVERGDDYVEIRLCELVE